MRVVVGEGALEEIRETSDMEGELGQEVMRDTRDLVSKVGEESVDSEDRGGTGMGDKVTLVVSSADSDVMIS